MSKKTKIYEFVPTTELLAGHCEEKLTKKGPWFGKRHWMVLTLTLLSETTHSVNAYMTVCIVAMTDAAANSNKDIPTYNWTNTGVILSAFSWGLCVSQMFAVWLVSKYKVKRIILFMVILCSIIGFLIPTIASYVGSVGVIICRLIQGMSMGCLVPSIYYLHGKWIPPAERGTLMAIAWSGTTIGVMVSMTLSGLLAASRYGWPLVIYFYSSVCLIWCIIFTFVGYNSPAEHPTISKEEQFYIEQSLSQEENKKLITPYKKIITSPYIWANIIFRLGAVFGYFLILSEISTYLNDILLVRIDSNGLLSAVPYFCTLFFIYFFGFLCDFFFKKQICSRTTIRKIMAFIGSVLPSIILILLAHCEAGEKVKVIIFLSLIVSLDFSGNLHSTLANPIDLAPNHAGAIEGMNCQISFLSASIGPMLVQFIVSGTRNQSEWKTIFYTVAVVKTLTSLTFLIFGSAETQPWNDEICTETDLPVKLEEKFV